MIMPSKMYSQKTIEDAIGFSLEKIGLSKFKTEQEKALSYFLNKNDVFVSLPTGFGKSSIYEAVPFCCDFINTVTDSVVIVISPLVSLMMNQLQSLQDRGIPSLYLGEKDDIPAAKAAKIILASPETIMGDKGRKLLLANRTRIAGVFVDESHCVAMW